MRYKLSSRLLQPNCSRSSWSVNDRRFHSLENRGVGLSAILYGNAKRGGVMNNQKLQLLSDDQVQRFIADGFVIIDSKLEASFHQKVAKQIAYALEYELPHPGGNGQPGFIEYLAEHRQLYRH